MADLIQYYGTGRRKSSIARVFLRPGSGKFTVNGKESDVYFVTAQQRAAAKRSLGIAGIEETFDVITTVKGGGVMGQADAVKLGIASTARRALALASSSPRGNSWSTEGPVLGPTQFEWVPDMFSGAHRITLTHRPSEAAA